jgi:hypothetical protein
MICLVLMTTILLMFLSYRRSTEKTIHEANTRLSQQEQEISRLAHSVISATTEATTRLSESQQSWMATMYLGREQALGQNGITPEQVEQERQPTPGIDTLEGLPDQIASALRREAEERRVWKLPQVPLEETSTNGQQVPESWITE